MHRHHAFPYFLASAIVFSSACAAELLDEAQADGADEAPGVALTSQAVTHGDSLTLLHQEGIGATDNTAYGVSGTLRVGITGRDRMYAEWHLENGNSPSRVHWAFTANCEGDTEDFFYYDDNLFRPADTNGQTWVCNRVVAAEFSFIVDN